MFVSIHQTTRRGHYMNVAIGAFENAEDENKSDFIDEKTTCVLNLDNACYLVFHNCCLPF
jgi:hypothetical protein